MASSPFFSLKLFSNSIHGISLPALLLKIRPALGRPLNFDYFDGSIDYAKIIVSMSDWRPAKTLPVALSFEVYHFF